jgi:hypothetical protein
MKEKATNIEVKLQYTISILEEKHEELKKKLDKLRFENCKLSDKIKNKFGSVSPYLLILRYYSNF